ncbi:MAG: hypothetical protein AAGG56_01035 [Pseudomonadota bacterium]
MDSSEDKAVLRARDFWTSIGLFILSAFFIWRTTFVWQFGAERAGVSGSNWYDSAALVPFGIFGLMLLLSLVLFGVSVRDGGAARALSAAGVGWNAAEAVRFGTIAIILFFYIASLVPRVDFIIASGLLITALIYGYHGGHRSRMWTAAGVVALPGLYAMIVHLPQKDWGAHDDDVVALLVWIGLTVWMLWRDPHDRIARITPVLATVVPFLLVCAMAFGFRQNVPNRGGLLFAQIEYNYYVNLKPLWSG